MSTIASARMNSGVTPRPTRRFLFLLASARRHGNTEQLARCAARALPACTERRWLHLSDVPLPQFEDVRHGTGCFPTPSGNELLLLEETLAATDLVLAVPLYWYTVPASAKLYFDYWTAWLRHSEFEFATRMRGKTMWVVCTASSDDPSHAAPLLGMLRLTADYLGMHWGGALLGCGNRPGEVFDGVATLAGATAFFQGAGCAPSIPFELDSPCLSE